MEQLSREALQLLMERAQAIEARSLRENNAQGAWTAQPRTPWAKRDPAAQPHASSVQSVPSNAGCMGAAADEGCGEGQLMPIGIERRLVRRAEARWASLRHDGALPDVSAASALLGPPFAGRAMLISFSQLPTSPDLTASSARVSHIGEALAALCDVSDRVVAADGDPAAPLAERLVSLAASAIRSGSVRHLDSDEDSTGGSADGPRPHLLLRAVALPLAPARNGGASAIVIASWRKLLSQDETVALHLELATAIAWMRDLGAGT